MQSFRKQYRGDKLVVETDFVSGDGWHIDIGRSPQSDLSFIQYEIEQEKINFGTEVMLGNRVLVLPSETGLVRHVRLPGGVKGYESVCKLMK
jgi:hypothetical protein